MTARTRRAPSPVEFTTLLALSMGLTAMGVDIMLPALGEIRTDFGLPSDSTAVATLLTAYFAGLAVGQLAYGPAADRFGRRRALFVGYSIYLAGALASAASPTLAVLIVSRFVWGFGAAGPRVVTIAMVRDTYAGERMSRAMSLIMAVFILVPVIAPLVGAAIVSVASWRWVFGVCVISALAVATWAIVRLPESLAPEHQLELRFRRIAIAARVVASDRQAVGYGLAMTAVSGAFLSYLASSEIIIGEALGRADLFPYIFATLAAVMGGAMLLNARIVGRVGTRRLAHGVLLGYLGFATIFLGVGLATGGRPPVWLFVLTVAPLLASHGLLIPNLNTVAMVNMAPIAGTASSLLGASQIAIGAGLGALIDQAFSGTVLPLASGFLGFGTVATLLIIWVERGRLFQPLLPRPEVDPIPPATEL